MTDTRTTCERCGTLIDGSARFCSHCGAVTPVPASRASDTKPLIESVFGDPRPATKKPVGGSRSRLLDHLRDATLGEYEILAELGQGGMATVFLAHDLQLDRRVAIKLMHPALLTGDGMVERFILEARTAAGLSHPHIIPIYAVKVQEELLFFVMKFVEGRPLDSIIAKEAPLPVDMVRQIVSQIAEALGYAHQRGVIHRDIKPANIMISTDGQPVLTDFGIAKVASHHGLTMTGATIGTPIYMSPEQCNALPLTGASDQYSLGIMAYEMLTGKPPFDADSVMTIMFKHLSEVPTPVCDRIPDCPADLAATIERMLAKSPEGRFGEMGQVVQALKTASTTSENQVRTQLVHFAMAGSNREVLNRVSTPRSPLPSSLSLRPKTKVGGAVPRTVVTPTRRSRLGPIIGGVALLLIAGAVAILQPWKKREPTSPPVTASNVPPTSPAPSTLDTVAPDTTPSTAQDQTPPTVEPQPPTQAPVRTTTRAPAPKPVEGRVATVKIAGPTALSIGGTGVLQAQGQLTGGQGVPGRPVAWSSSAPEVVSVSGGQLTAHEAGRAVIMASIDGVSQSVTVTVSPEAIAAVAVTPVTLTLDPGQSATLTPVIRGTTGRTINRPVEWSSNAPAVATVSSDGLVTGRGAGSAMITAVSGGERGTAAVTVQEAAPSDADLKNQVASTIQAYAIALQSRDVAKVHELYPAMPEAQDQQLRQALPGMDNLRVRLAVGQVQLSPSTATVHVTGTWVFTSSGRSTTLPADNTYQLERRGSGWVITGIR